MGGTNQLSGLSFKYLRNVMIEHGYRVLFTTAAGLITALTKAAAEGCLEERLKIYTVPRLLIYAGDRC